MSVNTYTDKCVKDVRYLAIDSNTFVATEAALIALHHTGGLTRVIYDSSKQLIAYSDRDFHQDRAITMAIALGFDFKTAWIMTTKDLTTRLLEDDGTETVAPSFRVRDRDRGTV